MLVGDAHAGVPHPDRQARLGGTFVKDRDGAALAVVLHGVGQEVEHDLLQPLPVRLHEALGLHRRDVQSDALLRGEGKHERSGLPHHLVHADRLDRERERA